MRDIDAPDDGHSDRVGEDRVWPRGLSNGSGIRRVNDVEGEGTARQDVHAHHHRTDKTDGHTGVSVTADRARRHGHVKERHVLCNINHRVQA